jgi:hypothetical protein
MLPYTRLLSLLTATMKTFVALAFLASLGLLVSYIRLLDFKFRHHKQMMLLRTCFHNILRVNNQLLLILRD